jgi:hypothetical protein
MDGTMILCLKIGKNMSLKKFFFLFIFFKFIFFFFKAKYAMIHVKLVILMVVLLAQPIELDWVNYVAVRLRELSDLN